MVRDEIAVIPCAVIAANHMYACPHETNLIHRLQGRREQRKQAKRHPRLIRAENGFRLLIIDRNIADPKLMQRVNFHRANPHIRPERLCSKALCHRADLCHKRLRAYEMNDSGRADEYCRKDCDTAIYLPSHSAPLSGIAKFIQRHILYRCSSIPTR